MSDPMTLAADPHAGVRAKVAALYETTKPRLVSLVLFTVAAGYVFGAWGAIDWFLLVAVTFGTALVAGGGSALNMYVERDLDGLMNRTRNRPLPAGKLASGEVLAFGITLAATGTAFLWLTTNMLTALLGVAAFVNYVLVYTPMKTRTTLNTLVGAITGALPPAMGWTAATGEMGTGAWVFFAILFIWQMPHFLSLAYLCREDYERGGMKMISVVDDERCGTTTRQIALYSIVAIPVTLLPATTGLAGLIYAIPITAFGLYLVVLAVRLAIRRTRADARRMFLVSLLHLPALFGLLTLDRLIG